MSLSSDSSLSEPRPDLPEKKPGTIYIRLIKSYEDAKWYSISQNHIERVIYDSDGFRIIFNHPLPPEIISWSTGNSYTNCRFKSCKNNTLLLLDDPKKDFKCFKCKLLYEKESSEESSTEYLYQKEVVEPIAAEFPAIWDKVLPKEVFQFPKLQIKSPTLLLLLLSFSLLFDWSIPLISILIIWLGLSYQEN